MTSRITAKTCTPNVSDLCSKVVHNPTMRSLWGLWRALPCGRLVPHLHDTTGCQSSYTTHFDNRLYRVNKHPTGCQTRLSNRIDNRLDVCLHDTAGCQTGCQARLLTTVLNEQPLFVQPVVKPGCTTGLTTGLTTSLTTGCIV